MSSWHLIAIGVLLVALVIALVRVRRHLKKPWVVRRRLYERAMKRIEDASAWNSYGSFLKAEGDVPMAITAFKHMRKKTLADPHGHITACVNLAELYRQQGKIEDALEAQLSAHGLMGHLDSSSQRNRAFYAMIVKDLAGLYEDHGDLHEAGMFYEEAIQLHEALEDSRVVARLLGCLGVIRGKQGDLDQSYEFLDQALVASMRLDDMQYIGLALFSLAQLHHKRGDQSKEESCLIRADGYFERVNDKFHQAMASNRLGLLYTKMGDPQKAEIYHSVALTLNRQRNSEPDIGWELELLGAAYQKQGKRKEANQAFKEALELYKKLADTVKLARVEALLVSLNQEPNA
jgi:tetratricopeptide (TPR) repeat protein